MNERLVGRVDVLQKKVDDFQEGIESMSTFMLCLMES